MQQAMLTDALGYVAAGLVFATFCAQRMASLRLLAIASNVAFIGYGFLDGLWPILILHSAMLPINIQRYGQLMRGHRGTTTADQGTPVPSRSTLPRNLITTALGQLCSRSEAVWRQVSSMFADDFDDLKCRRAWSPTNCGAGHREAETAVACRRANVNVLVGSMAEANGVR